MSQIIQNFNLILTEWKPENKKPENNRKKQKSKTKKSVISDTELKMLCYQKIEKVPIIKFFLVIFSLSLLTSTFNFLLIYMFVSIVHVL